MRCSTGSLARPTEAGQTTAELALLFPVVLLLALVLVQAALVLRDDLAVTNAAREAARAGAVDPDPGRARTVPVRLLFPLVFLVLPAFLLLTVVPVVLASLPG